MKIIKIALLALIFIMSFVLYRNIKKPMEFNEEKGIRYKVVIQKLKDVRTAEMAYKELKGQFADNFDALVKSVKEDNFMVVKVIGNPDDTTQVIRRDTFYEPVLLKIFPPGYMIDSLSYVPYGNGAKFSINAGEIERGKVKVKVFEISASNEIILNGLDEKYYNKKEGLQVGSMNDPTYTGNWEWFVFL